MGRYLDLSKEFPVGGTIHNPKYREYRDPSGVIKGKLVLANANTNKHEKQSEIILVGVPHWSAGHCRTLWDDYELVVGRDIDRQPFAVRTVAKGYKGQHLLGRNTCSKGYGWMAMGPEDINDPMMEMMAKLIAEDCHKHGWNPDRMVEVPDGYYKEGHGMIYTGKVNHVRWLSDHAQFAALDKYSAYRWDVGSQLPDVHGQPDKRNLMVPLHRKVLWYLSKCNGSYEFDGIL